ncbi:radical SAM protein [Candidatus Woesearchaeota archaeon]|nr:radical SAM protein [Candidatus Woesearchaeota archaeon]
MSEEEILLPELMEKAEGIYKENFPLETSFERAIFYSWGCNIGDCAFCYMSAQPKEKDPKETKRSKESILAELVLARNLGWDIGFITGGVGIYNPDEFEEMLKLIHTAFKEKVWISLGAIPRPILERYKPYIRGIVGSTETINPQLHKIICPSKPLEPYQKMFQEAKSLGIARAMTMILGMGETKEDLLYLKDFIEKYEINKIHIYSLKPRKGTPLERGKIPSKEEQAWWIAQLRIHFPKLDIQCGVWYDRLDRLSFLLHAGANNVSNFQATKLFGTKYAEELEREVHQAGRVFKGTLTKLPSIDWDAEVDVLDLDPKLKEKIKNKLNNEYLKRIRKNKEVNLLELSS